jgi:hypothetical protein
LLGIGDLAGYPVITAPISKNGAPFGSPFFMLATKHLWRVKNSLSQVKTKGWQNSCIPLCSMVQFYRTRAREQGFTPFLKSIPNPILVFIVIGFYWRPPAPFFMPIAKGSQ